MLTFAYALGNMNYQGTTVFFLALINDVTYSQVYSECVLCIYPSAHIHSSEHAHTVNTHPEHCGARGAVGGSVPCSRAPRRSIVGGKERCIFTPPTNNPCRTETRTRNLWIRDERVQHYLYLYLYLLTIWIICICICTRTGRGLTRKWAGFNLEVGRVVLKWAGL